MTYEPFSQNLVTAETRRAKTMKIHNETISPTCPSKSDIGTWKSSDRVTVSVHTTDNLRSITRFLPLHTRTRLPATVRNAVSHHGYTPNVDRGTFRSFYGDRYAGGVAVDVSLSFLNYYDQRAHDVSEK